MSIMGSHGMTMPSKSELAGHPNLKTRHCTPEPVHNGGQYCYKSVTSVTKGADVLLRNRAKL